MKKTIVILHLFLLSFSLFPALNDNSYTCPEEKQFELAEKALNKKNYSKAEKIFQQLANKERTIKNKFFVLGSRYYLGLYKLDENKDDLAEEYFRKVVQLNKGEYRKLQNLANKEINELMIQKKGQEKKDRARRFYPKSKWKIRLHINHFTGRWKCEVKKRPGILIKPNCGSDDYESTGEPS